MSIVSELRRRQVFRTAAWYGGLAWAAVEVADTVFPQFDLPGWSVRAVIVAAVLGLPVALLLAWFYDLTGAGLRREAATAGDAADAAAPARPGAPLWRIPSFWVALAIGAGLAVSAQQAWRHLIRPTFGERPGLAVLPFANLSPDSANAYFADGLHEEILATFARAGGLRVISRTSVQQYREPKRNLREIADALDVSLILEGSVRREGDDVRLSLQLIDGRTDEHLWAETYDRQLRDTLHLQRTVAQQVVAAIGARLSSTEQKLIASSSPTNPEAYEFYLRALSMSKPFTGDAEAPAIASLLDRTLELDPGFALGYALRARARVWIHFYSDKTATPAADGARVDIARALELQPDLPEALAARGLYHTYVSRDPERAVADLTRALAIAPNDAYTHYIAGLTLRRLGRFDEAVAQFRECARLGPNDAAYAPHAAQTLTELGRYDEADREAETMIRKFPERPEPHLFGAIRHLLRTGETARLREELERRAPVMPAPQRDYFEMLILLYEGKLSELPARIERLGTGEYFLTGSRDFDLGVIYAALGDERAALPHLRSVAEEAGRRPDQLIYLARGAVALELMGRRTEALRAADQTQELMQGMPDAVNTPAYALLRAWVLVRSVTRAEEGYAELDRWVGAYGQQPRRVAVDPLWRILRDDARAQQIIRTRFPSPPVTPQAAEAARPR